MSWIHNVVPPKIRSFLKRETPENLWVKCPDSGQLVFHKDLESNLFVVPGSDYHMRLDEHVRVIEQTVREKRPEGVQRAEYLQAHGMVDLVVHRRDMRATLARLCDILTHGRSAAAAPVRVPKPAAVAPPAAA